MARQLCDFILLLGIIICEQVGKPDSVVNDHLSRRNVAVALKPPPRELPGRHCSLHGVAPDRVYSTVPSPDGG